MKNSSRSFFRAAFLFALAFAAWTAAVCRIDVQPIGPDTSSVGFAAINRFFHDLTGTHLTLYVLTDWLSLIPLSLAVGFGITGLAQWIRRKKLWRVDFDLLALGGFYLAVLAAYALFEVFPVNFRPITLNGVLEPSYPSSTTVLVLCVMGSAILQFRLRIRSLLCRRFAVWTSAIFAAGMVLGRLIAGVHWFTDIAGGILLSASLLALYVGVCRCERNIHP